MRKHGGPPSWHDKQSRWRRAALPVLPGAALLRATSHVWQEVSRLPSSRAEPLPARHRGDARGNHGASLHDGVHLPTLLDRHALWGLGATGVVGGRPRGRWPATVVRGAWCQALSLSGSPVLWSGQPGFRDPCVPGAVGAGVGTQHRPHSVHPCGPALLAVGVAEGRPR